MDLITLDPNTRQAGKLIENYDSLIWTERFNTVGDFQIQTGNVDQFMKLLPEGTYLSLRESNVAMIVETHKIERKKNQPTKLTITGRSFESILDRRVAMMNGSGDWSVVVKTPSDAAYYAIVKICVDGILDTADIFPSAVVHFPTPTDYLASTGPNRSFVIPRGNLLSAVLQLLQTEAPADSTTTPATPAVVPHGIRAVRPNASGTAVGIEIYTGTDKTSTVVFDATRDLLDDGTYLFSKVGSATTAYGLAQNSFLKMNKDAVAATGLDRRVALVDATNSGLNDTNAMRSQMSQSLSEAKETALFDGSINQDLSPYVYGRDYNLGDIVKTVGDYGLETNARVTEYIRSEGPDGYKAYPTLVSID